MITRDDVRSFKPGDVLDVTLIDADHQFGSRVKHPGVTMRMIFEHVATNMTTVDAIPNAEKMGSPMVLVVWGKAMLSDVPEHVFVPEHTLDAEGNLRYGFHSWLVERIDLVP